LSRNSGGNGLQAGFRDGQDAVGRAPARARRCTGNVPPMSIASPDDTDPREFALQLAVIAARLDERSARAVQRVEAASAELGRQAASAAQALARERREAATIQQKVVESRIRVLMVASAALLVGALVAVAGASLAVSSAQRELDALGQDRKSTRLNSSHV